MRCEFCTMYYKKGELKKHLKVCRNAPKKKYSQEDLDRLHEQQYGGSG